MNLIFSFVFLLFGFSSTSNQPITDLTLVIENKEAKPGSTVCVNVTAADFKNLLSMQYSIKWDPAVLAFENVQGFKVPFLNINNFGAHKKAEGILTCVWIDNSLRGVNLPDGTAIYQLCFKVKGNIGSGTAIQVTPKPTPFEAVDVNEKVNSINGVDGSVVVK